MGLLSSCAATIEIMPSPVRNPLSARPCADEWHPTRNGDLTPDQVPAGTSRKAWWTCRECGHTWHASISNRAYNGAGCPPCGRARAAAAQRGRSAGPRVKSRAPRKRSGAQRKKAAAPQGASAAVIRNPLSGHPAASLFHPTRNGDLTPADVSAGSKRKVWWLCQDCGHEWETRVRSRTRARHACPACAQRAAAATNPLTSHPISVFFHPTRNGDLTADQVSAGSDRKVWWECPDCGHAWRARVRQCTRLFLCPRCRPRKTLADDPLAVEWHPTLNGDFTPKDFAIGSRERVWWRCPDCGHEWQATIRSRVQQRTGCRSCFMRRSAKRAVKNNPLSAHPAARLFHPTRNGDLTVDDIAAGSSRAVWWKCTDCGHEWQRPVNNSVPSGGCPECSPFSPANAVRRNPLSGHPAAAQFHPVLNGDLTPADLSAGSNRRVWWLCPVCGHEWEQTPNARTAPGKASGCPACANQAALGPRKTGTPMMVLADHPLFSEFHSTLNRTLFDPTKRSATSSTKVWWECPKCREPYMAAPQKRVKLGRGCPTCDDGRRHRWAKAKEAEAAKKQALHQP